MAPVVIAARIDYLVAAMIVFADFGTFATGSRQGAINNFLYALLIRMDSKSDGFEKGAIMDDKRLITYRRLLKKPPTLRQAILFFVAFFAIFLVVWIIQKLGYWPQSWAVNPNVGPE